VGVNCSISASYIYKSYPDPEYLIAPLGLGHRLIIAVEIRILLFKIGAIDTWRKVMFLQLFIGIGLP
jgi:hypothetical protein